MANTIKIKKYSDVVDEFEAAAAITPGMLLEVTSAGKVQAHSTAGGFCERVFALEDELQGGTIDDAYAAGDRVQCWFAGRGDVVYGILAASQTISIGDALVSNGDGTLKAATTEQAGAIVGVAAEAVTTSGSTGRIKVRVA